MNVVTISPSSVIATARVFREAAPDYINWSDAIRRIDTSSMPDDLASYATNLLQSAAAIISDQAAGLGAKAIALDRKIEKFIEAEQTSTASKIGFGLDVLGQHESFATYLEKKYPYGHTLTVAGRLDEYALFVSRPGFNASAMSGRLAWGAVLSESSKFDSKLTIKYRKLYAEAAQSISRKNGAKISSTKIARSLEELEIKLKLPKVPRIPKWARTLKLVPVAGAAVDGYIGYKQSAGSDWKTKLESGVNNAAGNLAVDAVPVAGQGVGIYDIGAAVTGNSEWQASELVRVEADAQVLGRKKDRQGLAVLLAQIKHGKKGLAYEVYGGFSEDEFVDQYVELAHGH